MLNLRQTKAYILQIVLMTHKTREILAAVEKVTDVDSETELELLIKILPLPMSVLSTPGLMLIWRVEGCG
jgi:hypothetical protein